MKQARLSEMFLKGFGIDQKLVRPAQLLDIIDSLLINTDIQNTVSTTKSLYALEYNSNINDLAYIASDSVFVKLLCDTNASQLYLELLTGIMLGTPIELPKSTLDDIFGDITKNSKYRALGKAVESINNVLTDIVIVYTQYLDKVVFVVLKGTNEKEYKECLAQSGQQSPVTLDKLHTALILKGII